jgi:hypothetical protein
LILNHVSTALFSEARSLDTKILVRVIPFVRVMVTSGLLEHC